MVNKSRQKPYCLFHSPLLLYIVILQYMQLATNRVVSMYVAGIKLHLLLGIHKKANVCTCTTVSILNFVGKILWFFICECIKFCGYKYLWFNLNEPCHQKWSCSQWTPGLGVKSCGGYFYKAITWSFHVRLQCIEKDGYLPLDTRKRKGTMLLN